jgi:UDP-glucose:(heptosyl)LPS alpha-1,3-glucosyltransferase
MKVDERPLKIAILLDKFLPSRGGERYFSFLATELARRGHEVHVFATKVETSGDQPYEVHIVPVWSFPRSLRIISFRKNSARLISQRAFDIVHGAAESTVVNVLNPHGGVEPAYLKQEFLSIRGRIYRTYRLLRRYLSIRHYLETGFQKRLYQSGRLLRVIAISTMIKNDIIRHYGFGREKITVVFNAVDLSRFNPGNTQRFRQDIRSRLGLEDSSIVLLFAGNNFRLKGLATLLHALALMKQDFSATTFCLLVAGRGHVGQYARVARKLGVEHMVRFLGAVGEMEQFYGASDIYVHPTFYDSCSLTVLEALASGLPVVTTRFNGASEAIVSDDGGKVLSSAGDPRELADAVEFYVDPRRREIARSVARSWMERYSPERNVEETIAVYRAALSTSADC